MIEEGLIGHNLMAPDGGGLYFEFPPTGVLCDDCGQCINEQYVPTRLKATKAKRYDIWSTYDNRLIVSSRFRSFCEGSGLAGCVFDRIGKQDWWRLSVDGGMIHVDVENTILERSPRCLSCGEYYSVHIRSPMYVVEEQLENHRFYATDVRFASRSELSRGYIVSCQLAQCLEQQRFRGLILEPIYSVRGARRS